MSRVDDTRVWIVVGALGAMGLGIALIPLRTLTSASNLAFIFLAFTIAVAEFGGRGPALAAALLSAMSLNFFLTEPYLTLAITKIDDVVAFFALAACGLIAAAFGKRRERWSEIAGRADRDLDVLKRLVERLATDAPLRDALRDMKESFRLEAIVLRDAGDRVIAAAADGPVPQASPGTDLSPDTLLPPDEARVRFGARGLRLPLGGGRLRLRTDRGLVSLDLWEGDAEGFGLDEARTLAIAVAMLGLGASRRLAGATGAR